LCYKLGAPKQFSNRLVETWVWAEQLITSTDFVNENLLRNHWMAEPHYEQMAQKQADIITQVNGYFTGSVTSPAITRKCQLLEPGQWHLPYVKQEDVALALIESEAKKSIHLDLVSDEKTLCVYPTGSEEVLTLPVTGDYITEVSRMVSAARCAWVSYFMPGEDSAKMQDITKALRTYQKLAGSNPRHLSPAEHPAVALPLSVRVGNHRGWMMHRKFIEGENGGDTEVISITAAMGRKLLDKLLIDKINELYPLSTYLTALVLDELTQTERKAVYV
jgi:hypothetical protein